MRFLGKFPEQLVQKSLRAKIIRQDIVADLQHEKQLHFHMQKVGRVRKYAMQRLWPTYSCLLQQCKGTGADLEVGSAGKCKLVQV